MDIKKSWLFSRPIAHRGLHGIDAPENSLAAFAKAIEAGYPIEKRELSDQVLDSMDIERERGITTAR